MPCHEGYGSLVVDPPSGGGGTQVTVIGETGELCGFGPSTGTLSISKGLTNSASNCYTTTLVSMPNSSYTWDGFLLITGKGTVPTGLIRGSHLICTVGGSPNFVRASGGFTVT